MPAALRVLPTPVPPVRALALGSTPVPAHALRSAPPGVGPLPLRPFGVRTLGLGAVPSESSQWATAHSALVHGEPSQQGARAVGGDEGVGEGLMRSH